VLVVFIVVVGPVFIVGLELVVVGEIMGSHVEISQARVIGQRER
jgi:hypothetical protein